MKRTNKRRIIFTLLFLLCQSAAYSQTNQNTHFFAQFFSIACNIVGCGFLSAGAIILGNHYLNIAKGFGGGYEALAKYEEASKLEPAFIQLKNKYEIQNKEKESEIETTKQHIASLKEMGFTDKIDDLEKTLKYLEANFEAKKERNKNKLEEKSQKIIKLEREGNALANKFEAEEGWKKIETHMHPIALSGITSIALGLYLIKQ